MDKTEKAILFEIHNMVSEMRTNQALQARDIEQLKKETDEIKKDTGKLKVFMIQAKVATGLILGAIGTLFKFIIK